MNSLVVLTTLISAVAIIATLFYDKQKTSLVACVAMIALAIALVAESVSPISIGTAVIVLLGAVCAFKAWRIQVLLAARSVASN